MPGDKVKILVLNQYFPPDRSATSQLLGQLVQNLDQHHEVTVICGAPTYDPDASLVQKGMTIKIHRTPLIKISRAFLPIRIINYLLFLTGAVIRALLTPKHDVVMCWTDPPLVGLIGAFVKAVKGSKLLFVSQDVYPEVAIGMGKMNDPFSKLILQTTSRIILKMSDVVVSIGKDMKNRLVAKGCPEYLIHVIPNWQDLEHLQPPQTNLFRETHQISKDVFIVMHSGNIGFSQDFETLLNVAKITKDKNILYLIIGDGGRKLEIANTIQSKSLENVKMLPYQPTSLLAQSLSAADLHYVSLIPELTGCVMPSKVYGILAVEKPFITNVTPDCDIAEIAKVSEAGIVGSSDSKMLAEQIIQASNNPEKLKEMGKKGRNWILKNSGRDKSINKYLRTFEKLSTS